MLKRASVLYTKPGVAASRRRRSNEGAEPLDDYLGDPSVVTLDGSKSTIHLHGHVDSDMLEGFLVALATQEADGLGKLVILDISSPGGDLYALSGILSAMKGSSLTFATYCSGEAQSAGAILLSAGEPGMRFVSPFGMVMMHSMIMGAPMDGIENFARVTAFGVEQNDTLMEFVAKNCKRTLKQLKARLQADGGRDLYMTPQRALEFGIVDHIGIPSVEMEVTMKMGWV